MLEMSIIQTRFFSYCYVHRNTIEFIDTALHTGLEKNGLVFSSYIEIRGSCLDSHRAVHNRRRNVPLITPPFVACDEAQARGLL
jgi:hypothetical protein